MSYEGAPPGGPPGGPRPVPLPAWLLPQGQAIPAGDAIARFTGLLGIRPCGGCKRRQARLNQRFVLVPRK